MSLVWQLIDMEATALHIEPRTLYRKPQKLGNIHSNFLIQKSSQERACNIMSCHVMLCRVILDISYKTSGFNWRDESIPYMKELSQPNSNTKRIWGDHIMQWNPPPPPTPPTQTFKSLPDELGSGVQPYFDPTRWIIEVTSIFLKMEDNLIFFKWKATSILWKYKLPQFFWKWKTTLFL